METFSSIYHQLLQKSPPKKSPGLHPQSCETLSNRNCMICPAIGYDYTEELKIKNTALKLFWEKNRLSGKLHDTVPSPRGRGYRTNSKRRVFRNRDQARLGLTEIVSTGPRGIPVIFCPIEPETHADIFTVVQKRLMSDRADVLKRILNYVIVRGDYDHHAVLFSVKFINPEVLREMNHLSKELTRTINRISGVFIFQDKPSSYYVSDQVRSDYAGFRKLFGKNFCTQVINKKMFRYSPLTFSQTNSSVADILVNRVLTWLDPRPDDVVFDLYCGYGLFGLSAADKVKAVIGADQSYESVDYAKENSKHFKLLNTLYFQKNISPALIPGLLNKHSAENVKIIIDPPRTGTPQGLIENIDSARIQSVIHLFCDIESLPREFKRWERNGFRIAESQPFDMFPATDQIEIAVKISN